MTGPVQATEPDKVIEYVSNLFSKFDPLLMPEAVVDVWEQEIGGKCIERPNWKDILCKTEKPKFSEIENITVGIDLINRAITEIYFRFKPHIFKGYLPEFILKRLPEVKGPLTKLKEIPNSTIYRSKIPYGTYDIQVKDANVIVIRRHVGPLFVLYDPKFKINCDKPIIQDSIVKELKIKVECENNHNIYVDFELEKEEIPGPNDIKAWNIKAMEIISKFKDHSKHPIVWNQIIKVIQIEIPKSGPDLGKWGSDWSQSTGFLFGSFLVKPRDPKNPKSRLMRISWSLPYEVGH